MRKYTKRKLIFNEIFFSSACSKKLAEWQETQGDGPRIILQRGAIPSGGGGRSPLQQQQQPQKIQTQPNIQSSTITASNNSNKERDTPQQNNTRALTEKKLSPVISEATNGLSKIRRKTKYPINIQSVSLTLPL